MKTKVKRDDLLQLRLNERDREILEKLQLKNRTLKRADIFRLALDALAEKQGLLADAS